MSATDTQSSPSERLKSVAEASGAASVEAGEELGPNLRIGDVAKLVGTTPRTIRYYEEIGLLPEAPDRDALRTSSQRDRAICPAFSEIDVDPSLAPSPVARRFESGVGLGRERASRTAAGLREVQIAAA